MARPAFSLSDVEARQLVGELAGVEARCPLHRRNHRQFVQEFIRIIHRVTGKTYSPAIYRRLLAAYAPERRPSTATLALEKERFARDITLACPASAAAPGAQSPAGSVREEIRQAVDDAMSRLASPTPPNPASYLQAQCEFLQQRLTHGEKQLAEASAAAHRLEAQRQVFEAQAERDREHIGDLRASDAAMRTELTNLARAIDDARQFALLAIDEARGETRAWKERCVAMEAQYKEQLALTETFRRLAYRQGADLPPALGRP